MSRSRAWRARRSGDGRCKLVSGEGPYPLAGGCLSEAVAVCAVSDKDVRVVQQPVDGCDGEGLGHQLVKPGWVEFELIAIERRSYFTTDAGGGTRTPKGSRPPAPKAGVSANSTTPADGLVRWELRTETDGDCMVSGHGRTRL